jgi:hypothetical protein
VSSPRWFNARFVAGIVVVVAPIVIGSQVLASANRYADVYVARVPLMPGEHVSAADLGVGRVRFDGQAPRYVAAGRAPLGYVVTHFVGEGELVPLSALSGAATAIDATRWVTVPVAIGHVPGGLARGELVDVYVTAKSQGQPSVAPPAPRLVISAAPVDSVTGSGALASSGNVSVVLEVPSARVAAVVDAIETGTIDVVRVPA